MFHQPSLCKNQGHVSGTLTQAEEFDCEKKHSLAEVYITCVHLSQILVAQHGNYDMVYDMSVYLLNNKKKYPHNNQSNFAIFGIYSSSITGLHPKILSVLYL